MSEPKETRPTPPPSRWGVDTFEGNVWSVGTNEMTVQMGDALLRLRVRSVFGLRGPFRGDELRVLLEGLDRIRYAVWGTDADGRWVVDAAPPFDSARPRDVVPPKPAGAPPSVLAESATSAEIPRTIASIRGQGER